MSLDATRWAWIQHVGSSSEKLVLLSMSDRAGDDHTCFPSIERLELDTELNRKTIMRSIKRLIEKGLIEDTGKCRGTTGKIKVYRLMGVQGRDDIYQQEKDKRKKSTSNTSNDDQKNSAEQSQNGDDLSAETDPKTELLTSQKSDVIVPILPGNSTNFTNKQSQNRDSEPIKEPIKESIDGKAREKRTSPATKKTHVCFDRLPAQISIEIAMEFIEHRKALKAPLTQYGFDKAMAEACKAPSIGLTPDEAIDQTILAGWKGINITWLQNRLSRTESYQAANTAFSADISWAQDLGL